MKQIGIIVGLIFPFIGYSQVENEIRSMLTVQSSKIDTATHRVIAENVWKTIYFYENNQLEKIGSPNFLRLEDEEFFITLPENQKTETAFLGRYYFDKNFLFLYDYFKSPECPQYKIISLIDNEYLVVEVFLFTGKNDAYKTTNRRVLFQRQNMPAADKVFNEERAMLMLKDEPLGEANYTSSTVEGVWKMIYTYGDFLKPQKELYKITAGNILNMKDGAFHRIYPNNVNENDTGRYFIDGTCLSLFSEIGKEYVYRIVNMFDDEYLVTEMVYIKNKGEKTTQRFLYRRMRE
jgi:hypothetical protein